MKQTYQFWGISCGWSLKSGMWRTFSFAKQGLFSCLLWNERLLGNSCSLIQPFVLTAWCTQELRQCWPSERYLPTTYTQKALLSPSEHSDEGMMQQSASSWPLEISLTKPPFLQEIIQWWKRRKGNLNCTPSRRARSLINYLSYKRWLEVELSVFLIAWQWIFKPTQSYIFYIPRGRFWPLGTINYWIKFNHLCSFIMDPSKAFLQGSRQLCWFPFCFFLTFSPCGYFSSLWFYSFLLKCNTFFFPNNHNHFENWQI